MLWHEILYKVLDIINQVVLYLIGIPFLLQLIYMIFFWLKKKTYPKSDKKGKIAVIIPAHNEEDVIYDTLMHLYNNQTYPKDKYDVYVACHNCTDNTVELVKKAGAIPIIYNNDNPKEAFLAYCLNYAFDYLLNNVEKEYDLVVRLDADNYVNDEFLSLMNDAFQSGVKFGRGYESAKNMTQNLYTKACGLYYVFDSRFGSRVREKMHIGAHVNGPGMMVSYEVLKNRGGYKCYTISEDAEFTIDLMNEGIKGHFIEDAVIYEDLPSTLKDTYNRNIRIGSGSRKLIFGKLGKLFLKFFVTGRFSYIELFLTYFFNIICVLLCSWLPLYYIYNLIYLGLCGYGNIATSLGTDYYLNLFYTTIIVIVVVLVFLFLFCGWLQGFLLILLDYKKMGAKNRRELFDGALMFPFFSVVYIVTICFGMLSKPKWNKVKRNKQYNKKSLN